MQEVPIEVARGEIVDRNGLALTNTAQHFTLLFFQDKLKMRKWAKSIIKLTGSLERSILSQIQVINDRLN